MLRLVAAVFALTFIACDERFVAPSSTGALVAGSPWRLQSLERPGPAALPTPDPERFTLQFTDQGRVAVVADCNRCNGVYTLTAHELTVSALACTRAFCQSAPFDTDYVGVLTGESAVGISRGALRLSSARGTLRFAR